MPVSYSVATALDLVLGAGTGNESCLTMIN